MGGNAIGCAKAAMLGGAKAVMLGGAKAAMFGGAKAAMLGARPGTGGMATADASGDNPVSIPGGRIGGAVIRLGELVPFTGS